MTVKLTYDVLAKMFRCQDCIIDPPIEVHDIPGDHVGRIQRVKTLHAEGCVRNNYLYIDAHLNETIHIQSQTAYMPAEVADGDSVLKRLEGKV